MAKGGFFMDEKQYQQFVDSHAPKSPLWKDVLNAFWIGGLICVLAQAITNGWQAAGLEQEQAGTATSICMVAISALLTGLSLYDDIAKVAGAGTLVPITGFANAMVAPAMEFRAEGLILGVGAKLFTIAGPVLVNGISASVVYGVIYYVVQCIA
jgi:stage V sporulation protein AC